MYLFLMTAISVSFVYAGGDHSVGCPSTVFLEYAKISVIACAFPPMFESVFWYDISDQGPFISYELGSKSGPGYESGEFDIDADGSLIIHNVTLDHDRQFRVFVHYEEWQNDIRQEVHVMVYVKASSPFPYINLCKEDNHCHIVIRENVLVTCSVNATRPAADLTWLKMEGSKTTLMSSENYETDVRHTTSSFVSTKVTLVNNRFLEVMKCKSRSLAPLLEKDHSVVLIEKYVDDFSSELPTTRLSKRNNNVILDLQKDVYAVVWKKRLPTGIYQTIGYYTYDVSEVYDDVFHITDEGYLSIESLQLEYEGEYLAVYATTTMQTYETFQVHVYIPPTPPFPQIYECSDEPNCEIKVERTGRLTCSLKGIRPLVHLEWVFNGGVSPITFDSPLESIADRGETFDYSVTTSFAIKSQTIQNNIEVTCQVAEELKGLPTMKSNITLVYGEESKEITYCEKAEEKYRFGKKLLIAGVSLASSFILCCYCSLWCMNLKGNDSYPSFYGRY